MSDEVYRKLAKLLDSLPNGFPATPDGLEIAILKKIFTPEEADLCCDLKVTRETAEQIAQRTGRPLQGLEDRLTEMTARGEIWGMRIKGKKVFWLMPWIVGIWEFQVDRMDREFCEMCEKYKVYFGSQLVQHGPEIMMTLPVEEHIPSEQQAMPFEQVSRIIDQGIDFRVGECVCKKEQGIMDRHCSKPTEVCMAIVSVPDTEALRDWGRRISKEEAREVLRKAEEAALVHLTGNVREGHWFICNCCGCCCGVLRPMNQFGLKGLVNSRYYAVIDTEECIGCGVCKEDRCQVNAIVEEEEAYRVDPEKCIGCGLCLTDCSVDCIQLVRRPEAELLEPYADDEAWNRERAARRGLDFDAVK
jgi:electron transport complex protein RnfB